MKSGNAWLAKATKRTIAEVPGGVVVIELDQSQADLLTRGGVGSLPDVLSEHLSSPKVGRVLLDAKTLGQIPMIWVRGVDSQDCVASVPTLRVSGTDIPSALVFTQGAPSKCPYDAVSLGKRIVANVLHLKGFLTKSKTGISNPEVPLTKAVVDVTTAQLDAAGWPGFVA